MGDYGEWSPCTKECGGGTQIRTREIIQQAENNGTACGQQPLSENRTCNVHDCAGTNCITNISLNSIVLRHSNICLFICRFCNVLFSVNCEFGDWKNWTTCDKPCGGGSQYRTREVKTFARHGGELCQGDAKEVQVCNSQPCPSKHN